MLYIDRYFLAQEKKTIGEKVKSFWQKLFDYPANVTNEAAGVVTEAITGTTNVVTKEVKTVGQVTSGRPGEDRRSGDRAVGRNSRDSEESR